ncbi:MAG: hypothetical protein LBT46_03055, partial [Planctomycetaceae bacterium]|nr:hypothetical protein [Planctomycetaceae bacterium]
MTRFGFCTILSAALLWAAGVCTADCAAESEQRVSAATESVALFKNGFTIVRQEITVPAPGVYRWDEIPAVIHGTFFIESGLNVEIQTTQRLVTLPIDARNTPPQSLADIDGKNVNIFYFDSGKSFGGKFVGNATQPPPNSLLPELTRQPSSLFSRSYSAYPIPVNTPLAGTPMILEMHDKTYMFLTGRQNASITTTEPLTERTERRPVMIFHASAKDGKTAGTIRLFYLTKGTAWAPSYRVDLLDGKRLSIEQVAVIRNEWMPLHNTEISLVSGFPQIETSQILSPLNPNQTLERFFQQILSQQSANGRVNASIMSNSAMITQQQIHPSAVANAGFDTTALASGEGPDIHYNNIGRKTLDTGDTLSLSTGKGETDYRRILECELAPQSQNNPPMIVPDVFDVLKFQNPLPFPMTTAPAMVTEQRRFLGQSQSNWVNPGQTASVKVTKVMN